MDNKCTIQIFLDGAWRDAATVSLVRSPEQGWRAATYGGYLFEHAFDHAGRRDAAACSYRFPVGMDLFEESTWPAWLVDLLPQGYGRQELLRQLDLSENTEARGDWPLLLVGAGNPIGNLRVKEAAQWLAERAPADLRGFRFDEVAGRHENFVEHLAGHGLFVAGSSGVQGEWPKVLLAEAEDGLLYLDHALPDERAQRHWLVKFHRGNDSALNDILEAEAPYVALARELGLRVPAPLRWQGRTLFIPRFDRQCHNGRVVRIGQESLASLCGRAGFGIGIDHEQACAALADAVDDPVTEIVEYLKRDLANLALGNKDNHARNTAIARHPDGHIALTPLFDFAPMALHPDGIARMARWPGERGGQLDWTGVVRCAAEAADIEAAPVMVALRAMAPKLHALPERMKHWRLKPALIDHFAPGARALAKALEQLPDG